MYSFSREMMTADIYVIYLASSLAIECWCCAFIRIGGCCSNVLNLGLENINLILPAAP